MIIDQLLGLLHGLLAALVALMPKFPYPLDNTFVNNIAPWIALMNSYVPFAGPLGEILKFMGVALPALLGYRVVLFIYNRIRG